jgi:hypothetical protein
LPICPPAARCSARSSRLTCGHATLKVETLYAASHVVIVIIPCLNYITHARGYRLQSQLITLILLLSSSLTSSFLPISSARSGRQAPAPRFAPHRHAHPRQRAQRFIAPCQRSCFTIVPFVCGCARCGRGACSARRRRGNVFIQQNFGCFSSARLGGRSGPRGTFASMLCESNLLFTTPIRFPIYAAFKKKPKSSNDLLSHQRSCGLMPLLPRRRRWVRS